MATVVLIIHLVLAIFLIAVVLLQRSEGGALGIGGGGGGLVSARGATTALSKLTWALAIGFICTSVALTILAGRGGPVSVFDDAGPVRQDAIPLPALPGGGQGGAGDATGGADGAAAPPAGGAPAPSGQGGVPLPPAPAPSQ
jgi:preprotein translocase subunit SecG